MNEAETRAELIDPKLKACGWGVTEGSKVLREYRITAGRIQAGNRRGKKLIADYVLVYKGFKLAVVEAKSDELEVGEGVAQAKEYADKLKRFRQVRFTMVVTVDSPAERPGDGVEHVQAHGYIQFAAGFLLDFINNIQ